MSLIVEAYNAAAAKTADTKEAKRDAFVNEMASKLKVNISDIDFKEKMGKAYDSMHVYYDGKAVPAGEKDNPSIAQDKTYGEAFKAAILMVVKILLVFPLLSENLSDNFTSSRVAKTSFADSGILEKVFEKKGGIAVNFDETKRSTFAAIEEAKKAEAVMKAL